MSFNKDEFVAFVNAIAMPIEMKNKIQSYIESLLNELENVKKSKNDLRISLQTSMNDANVLYHRQNNELKQKLNEITDELNEYKYENKKLQKENTSIQQIYVAKFYELNNMNKMYKKMLDLQTQMNELKSKKDIFEEQFMILENEHPTFLEKNQPIISEEEDD
ncbi:V11 [Sputnik virophage]|uniref:Uncharacterized protein V11 n=4 Tax=Mimivirus-dependent virus Sputnik TaxID=1932927 RepID=V11_SPTNK|nr:V11 [Sputnik virophage]B4YNF1.1 RecName: Full=Uncharacterized protein V11 [Sputnik virophage]AUG84998.1 hypothetical protein [Sputnik virophage 2]UMZ08523.1 hypothetical protein [Mimivirus-dependent virus Sputnik]VAV82193.1 hypothetical protein GUARANI_14 [Guarani virophage]ACF16995.1 V11 [Sputnik virophage]